MRKHQVRWVYKYLCETYHHENGQSSSILNSLKHQPQVNL